MHKFSLFSAVLLCAFSFSFAQDILVNVVGYEKSGAKRAVIQHTTSITDTKFEIIDAQGNVVTKNLGAQASVKGWSGRTFKVADFSDFKQDGKYRLRVGSVTSPEFEIGEKILQRETGAFQVSFFNGMRNTDEGDSNLGIRGSSQTHNIYGGWWDATGDPGKHLSHLSYANYFNPQQIPLVVWALLQANEFQPTVFSTLATEEAAWGADYLLRSLSTAGYFYMSVFDDWGAGYREICEWSGSDGARSDSANAYRSAMREGGGVSIAALARASKAGISGDSSFARYLAGAKRAYAHLKANPTTYQNDGKENIIDDYTGLLAASELYNATQENEYLIDAQARAASLLAYQSEDGWFYSDKLKTRPFYHAADEGFPVVALARYVEICKPSDAGNIRQAIRKNFQWYIDITYQESNPFEYVKMYGSTGAGTDPTAINLALNGTATASRSEGAYTPDKAIDGGSTNDSRWSSYQSGATDNDVQWIIIELEETYKVNKVVLNWEAAYGKVYDIEVSTNGTSWIKVAGETNNTSVGRKEYSFTATNARYVKMNGKQRGNEYGGFSLYEFEIYGEQEQPITLKSPARFFMPHDNETKYWWQGENARIASLSAAFAMGAQLAALNREFWYDTLFAMTTAQLDWILGKNPFGVSMMFGFGTKNYPDYTPGARMRSNIKGGICNGITAMDGNESNLEWKPYRDDEWQNWRWIEQWLPHNAWYLTAISAISYTIDNPITPIKKSDLAKASHFKISVINGRNMNVELPFAADKHTSIDIYNMRGQKLLSYSVPAGNLYATIEMPSNIKHGVYILSVKNMAGKTASGRFIFGQ